MTRKRYIVFMALIGGALVGVSLSNSCLWAKPLIRIGMKRAELAKALPGYAKAFAAAEPQVFIEEFPLYGMKGKASFAFFHKDRLIVFIWEYKTSEKGLGESEMAEYSKMIKGLQKDFGAARSEPSASDPNVILYYWRMPKASGHTSYGLGGLKFQMADSTWLESVRPR